MMFLRPRIVKRFLINNSLSALPRESNVSTSITSNFSTSPSNNLFRQEQNNCKTELIAKTGPFIDFNVYVMMMNEHTHVKENLNICQILSVAFKWSDVPRASGQQKVLLSSVVVVVVVVAVFVWSSKYIWEKSALHIWQKAMMHCHKFRTKELFSFREKKGEKTLQEFFDSCARK